MPVSFPRGGKRIHEEQKNKNKDEADLFQTAESVSSKTAKSKGRKKLKASSTSTFVESLSFQTLREGLLLFGRVKEVQAYKVMMSLPRGLLGTLPIAAISHAYTQRLQAVADADNDNDEQDVPSLKDLFKVGDGVLCCVTSVTSKGSKRYVGLTSDPRVIYKDLPVSALKEDCLVYGAIESIEDHGCMMDIGVPGIHAFLVDTDLFEEDAHLSVGKGIWCRVCSQAGLEIMSGETRVIKVTAHNVQHSEVSPQSVSSIECLYPGLKVNATVEKVLKDGMYVKVMKYKGCVHRTHVLLGLSNYKVGQKVEGRILYIHPTTKIVSISLLPGLLNCVQSQTAPFAGLSVGDILEEAQVMYVDKTSAVFFKLPGCTGLAQVHELSDEKIKDVNQTFPCGSKHRCRVIGFQPADDVVLVSLKQSVIQQKILSIQDIHPGQIITGEVETAVSNGVIVSLGKGLTGFISKLHVADVPLKNFSKKFIKGYKVKCRVLKVDDQTKKVYLSSKKSLVTTTKDVPSTYAGLTPGMQVEGFVISVKDAGVAVGFCADVKGWVPRSELSTVEISHPETAFYQGQVVRCRVLSCHADQKKLYLSFIISGKAAIASRRETMDDFEVGKLHEAKVLKKLEKNLEVELQPSGTKALLPREHLADSHDNQLLLWRALEPGHSVGSVMLFKQTNVVVVTRKESFLSAARENLIPKSIQDLEPGQLLPGAVRNHQHYGMFVELAGGLGGLAPYKFTIGHPVADLTKLFVWGQSVVVKVMEVNHDKSRFLCSVRMQDCYHDNPMVSVEMLETYLQERDEHLGSLLDDKVASLKTGSLLSVEVKKKTTDGYICATTFGIPAIITRCHTGEAELKVGQAVEAVLLHITVDESDVCLELSSDPSLVRARSRRMEKPSMDKARVGQNIKAQVVLSKEDFVLLALKQHAQGTMAFIPKCQHPNDVLARTTANLSVGEETKVTIQKCDGERVLAILSSLAKEEEVQPRHSLQLGEIVTAQVQTVLPNQVNLKIKNVNGRVHVTEVVDDMKNGMFPFSNLKKNQEITVKIIGFRHFKSFKYLPISHPRLHKAMPECTLKPSKLQHDGCPLEDQASYMHTYTPGTEVPVFVLKFDNNKLWVHLTPTQNGVISIFDLSRDLGILKQAEKHFMVGHGYLATVLGVEKEGLVHLSLTGKKESVKKNQVVIGKVTSISDKGMALRLPGDFRGMVSTWDSQEDFKKQSSYLTEGSFIRCLVLCCKEKEKCVLSLNLTHRSEEDLKKIQKKMKPQIKPQKREKRKCSTEAVPELTGSPPPKRQRTVSDDPEECESMGVSDSKKPECHLTVSTGFVWDSAPASTKTHHKNSSEDEEEEVNEPPKKKKKTAYNLSGAGNTSSQKEDYERLLLATPNDSKLWIELMCQQLQDSKVDAARATANQALQTIAPQGEQEKLNVWLALLNLENLYGSKEEMKKTLQRALQVSDPYKLYPRLAAMYSASGKLEECEQIHQTMVHKFKQERQVWINFGLFLYKQGRPEPARKLLQRALLSLDHRDHVATITQFASLECKHGEQERGFTMLEKVVAEFPKRSDVMSVYIDMVVRSGDLERARELFERALTLKNAKFFYKKYLQFEEKHGTEDTLTRLRSRMSEEC